MKDCLMVFAKEPRAGRVKTRLRKRLSRDKCVGLYKAFLRDTLELARAVKCLDKVLAYESSSVEPEYLRSVAGDFVFHKQKGRDLGERMHNAFKFARKMNCDKTVIVGSDIPHLPVCRVKEAYKRLDRDDLVLGPSDDGGYYLIGLKKPSRKIFKGVRWSSRTALADTVASAGKAGKRVSLLKSCYDIDEPVGLERLKNDLKKNKKAAPWTRKLLRI